jgi:type VI secretion system lysozyme-like protein
LLSSLDLLAYSPEVGTENVIKSIENNIRGLLNSRALFTWGFNEYGELLTHYGLPSLDTYNPNSFEDQQFLAQLLKNLFNNFETRIKNVTVIPSTKTANERKMEFHFEVTGIICISNKDRPLLASIKLNSQSKGLHLVING